MEEGLKNEIMLDDRGSFRPVEQNFNFSYLYKLVLKIKCDIWTDKMELLKMTVVFNIVS